MTPVSTEGAALAALASLPYMAWDRIDLLVDAADGDPRVAWRDVRRGVHGAGLARAAARIHVADVAAAHEAAGVAVRVRGDVDYPPPLFDDHEPPPVVFSIGSLEGLDRPRVAIIGTRRCTHYGRDVARELGRRLADAGVCVVSGLAAGIDGAAHEGALAGGAPPIAVVGSGLDVVYPRRHTRLWERVAQAGALLSEAPLGARPEPWRFPARNRIIAALAHVVVVVESHITGGSMHTVRAAEERSVPVLAVPGPIKSRASGGTNQLLSQGCHPVCDAEDVLAALSLSTAAAAGPPSLRLVDNRPAPDEDPALVLEVVDFSPPLSLETVLARSNLPPARASAALAWLEREGWVCSESAGWWSRC